MAKEGTKLIAQNKKARFNYSIEESIECGIVLEGTEVKSVKEGNFSFPDAFAEIINNEVWVKQLHISEYVYSSIFNHNPDRPKKLLLHKDEIKRLKRKVEGENRKRKNRKRRNINFELQKKQLEMDKLKNDLDNAKKSNTRTSTQKNK